MKVRHIFWLIICWLASSGAVNAQSTCYPPTPLPTSPSAQAQVTTLSASDLDNAFSLTLWREPCPSDSTQAVLYITATPTTGSPFFCPSDFTIIQNGIQHSNLFFEEIPGPQGYATNFCGYLLSPITVFVHNAVAPFYDSRQALTLAYSGSSSPVSAQLGVTGGGANGITPQVGLWWNPAESGSGYSLDYRHGVLVVVVFSYTRTGAPQWYLAAGQVINNAFTATLDRYENGQCIACAYSGRPTQPGNDGTITITFTSSTTATMTLPGNRRFQIVPQAF